MTLKLLPTRIVLIRLTDFPLAACTAQAQQVEDDRPKALPALGEQQNSNNGIRVCVHLGISDKAAWRKSISVEEDEKTGW
ncbi:unnamed protein product [Caretta caretta]